MGAAEAVRAEAGSAAAAGAAAAGAAAATRSSGALHASNQQAAAEDERLREALAASGGRPPAMVGEGSQCRPRAPQCSGGGMPHGGARGYGGMHPGESMQQGGGDAEIDLQRALMASHQQQQRAAAGGRP